MNAEIADPEVPRDVERTDAFATDETAAPKSAYRFWKIALEVSAALLLFLLTLPLVLLAMLLVKLTSRGPALFCQTRLGRGGRPFTIYKIRTMAQDAEKNGACWSLPGDSRITWIGRWLRATHIDELPQLWNVLKGDMSLVGPRPERPEFVPHLEQAIQHYRQRLQVRPGLTGLAQVQLPPDSDLESVRRKLAYDLYYVHRLGPWLDLRIYGATALRLVGLPAGWVGWLFALPGLRAVESIYRNMGISAELSADLAMGNSDPNLCIAFPQQAEMVESKPAAIAG